MIDNTDERARGEVDVRLEELALYVAGCFDGDPSFDATELDKILFYADFIAYFRNGEPITGAEYQRLQHGPAPREIEPVERDLVKRRFAQVRLVPLRKPNFALFSGSEIGIVDEVIATLRCHDEVLISALSRQFAGWKYAGVGESIPYHAALIPDDDWELDEAGLRFGAELAAKL